MVDRQAGKQPRLAGWLLFALRMGAGEWRSTSEPTCIVYKITSVLPPGLDGRKHHTDFLTLHFRIDGSDLGHRARPDHAMRHEHGLRRINTRARAITLTGEH